MLNKYRFGICEWSMPVSGPLAMILAGEAGYDGMQMGENGGRLNGYPLNNKRVQEIYLETAKAHNIEMHSLNLGALLSEGTLNYSCDTREGVNARLSLDNGFSACTSLGIKTVVITVNSSGKEQFENAVSHLKYAEDLADERGIKIAIESAQPLEEIESLLLRLKPETKICMDLLNPLRFCTGNPQEQIKKFGRDKISHFHMKDSVKSLFVPSQRGCVPLGLGDAGIEESVDLIKSIGYEGWMITENYYYLPPMNSEEKDFIVLAKNDLDRMKKYFKI